MLICHWESRVNALVGKGGMTVILVLMHKSRLEVSATLKFLGSGWLFIIILRITTLNVLKMFLFLYSYCLFITL